MKEFWIQIHNQQIRFMTNFEPYAQYFEAYFEPVLIKPSDQTPAIDITFLRQERLFSEEFHTFNANGQFAKIGANTFVSPDRIATVRKIERKWKVAFEAVQGPKGMKVTITHQQKAFKDFWRYGPFAGAHDEWFFALTYYLIYYPLFWILEHKQNTHMLHASAFRVFNKGVVVCGLEGIGKTSLGLKFLQEDGTQFLSDNLIFFDNQQVYPCYEMVRMHDTEDSLWKGHFEKTNQFKILKGFFKPKFSASYQGIKPEVLVFPEFTSDYRVQELALDEAVNRALVLSHLPAELNHYSEYRQFYNLLDLKKYPWQSQYDVLQQCLKGVKCLAIGCRKSEGLERNYQRIKETVQHA